METVTIKRKDGSEESVKVYSVKDFPYEKFNPIARSSRFGGRERTGYCLDFMTFDIETSTIPGVREPDGNGWTKEPVAFMYHWQACLGGVCIFGRRWEDFFDFCAELSRRYKLGEKKRLLCFVHNLGYEFGYLYPFFDKYMGGDWTMFATKPHEPVKVTTGLGIEFRCSLKLTNMSLYMFTKTELSCPYLKAWGDLDYSKMRTAKTPLTPEEKGYCLIDVLGLYHALKSKFLHDGDSVLTAPITSTGYPRRVVRRNCKHYDGYRAKIFNRCKLTYGAYKICKRAKRGGNTHASRFKTGKIWLDEYGKDFVSEYPGVMLLMDGYPMSALSHYGPMESLEEYEEMKKEHCIIMDIYLQDPKLKDTEPIPYIPIDKCWMLPGGKYKGRYEGIKNDNGRIVDCHGLIGLSCTEIDLDLILKMYDHRGLIISDAYTARRGMLPEPIRETVKSFFIRKCELKEQIKEQKKKVKANPTADSINKLNELTYLYGKIKNMLNGIFGMMYQDPVQYETSMDDESGEWRSSAPLDPKEAEEEEKRLLDNFNKSPGSFLCYAWGLYVPTWGRYWLDRLQRCAIDDYGSSTLLYSDTDSAKALAWDHAKVKELDDEIKSLNEEMGTTYTYKDGSKEYLLLPEDDGHAKRFITMGAKKYAYEDEDGILHVTVSGVANTCAPGDLMGQGARELGSLDNFKLGFKWRDAGGTMIYYAHAEPHYITVDHCRMLTASYGAILESEYTLGATEEYMEIMGFM